VCQELVYEKCIRDNTSHLANTNLYEHNQS
jgi:hypothetical protein